MASSTSTGVGSPCGACKFLRRRCTQECVFAPYFDSEQSPAQFAAIHKVFGASNVSKLLAQLPVHLRCDAVVTVAYEAQARIRDPVYGCVAHIFALQKQVAILQAQLMQVKAQLAYQATLPQAANGGSDGDRVLMQLQVMGCKEEPHHHFGELHAMAQRLMRS
ncbi:LOB domain-containing protein 16-like [Curcuma longa]|uniref:LOB domain-containing protein 16-like n=1 Tax=Curcuma longa TaxID=136217 RepID=UPI003D9E055F